LQGAPTNASEVMFQRMIRLSRLKTENRKRACESTTISR
jgi:hypothetical protein